MHIWQQVYWWWSFVAFDYSELLAVINHHQPMIDHHQPLLAIVNSNWQFLSHSPWVWPSGNGFPQRGHHSSIAAARRARPWRWSSRSCSCPSSTLRSAAIGQGQLVWSGVLQVLFGKCCCSSWCSWYQSSSPQHRCDIFFLQNSQFQIHRKKLASMEHTRLWNHKHG